MPLRHRAEQLGTALASHRSVFAECEHNPSVCKGLDDLNAMSAWYSKTSLQLALPTALRFILAPVVSVAMLIVSTELVGARFTKPYVALAIIAGLLCWILMGPEQRQRNGLLPSNTTLAGRVVFAWLAMAATLLLIAYATKTSSIFSRRALFLWFTITPPMLVAGAVALRQWLRAALVSSKNCRKVVIVGSNRMSKELAQIIHQRPELGLRLCRHIAEERAAKREQETDRPDDSEPAYLHDYVNSHQVDIVFVAVPPESRRTRALLEGLRDTTASVYVVPDISIFDLIQARSDDIQGIPVIAVCESPLQGLRGVAKRATDVVFASAMLVLFSPLMLAIMLVIKLTSHGGVIFQQDRYGLDGRKIVVYKFRTMHVSENGDRIVQAKRDDSRVTPVGRFLRRTSLDELPQLINVLQGRMSLVGPRPHAVAHNEQYRKLITGYMVRHKVAPGITGLAQVNGCRGETASVEEMRRRIEYDLEYLRQWCWLLDIKIMLRTCALLFTDKHAY